MSSSDWAQLLASLLTECFEATEPKEQRLAAAEALVLVANAVHKVVSASK